MKTVILYFPYIINLRAFVAAENLENVTNDPAYLFFTPLIGVMQGLCVAAAPTTEFSK